jgi:hypothetical protein
MLLEPVGKSCSVEALDGAVAQPGEHLLCKQGVSGSIPLSSTNRGTRLVWLCADAVAALPLRSARAGQ